LRARTNSHTDPVVNLAWFVSLHTNSRLIVFHTLLIQLEHAWQRHLEKVISAHSTGRHGSNNTLEVVWLRTGHPETSAGRQENN
ncbi:unnamed protein product, partial [Amoebophrya sp. A120]